MASRPRPFSDAEKAALLAEVIKTSIRYDSAINALRRVINDHPALDPQWYDMSLPHGRTPRECHEVLQELYINILPPLSASVSTPRDEQMAVHRAYPTGETATSTGRAILPRTSQGQPLPQFFHQNVLPGIPSSTLSSPYYELPPRKRGRPSNEQREHERQVAEARGEPWPPPKRPKRQRTTTRASQPPQETVAGSTESASEPPSATTPTVPATRTLSHPTSPTTTTTTATGQSQEAAPPRGPAGQPPVLPAIPRPLPSRSSETILPSVSAEMPLDSQRGPTLAPFRGVQEPTPQQKPYLYEQPKSPRRTQPPATQTTTAER